MYAFPNVRLFTDVGELVTAVRVFDPSLAYIASSWRNPLHDDLVMTLRGATPEQIAAAHDEADSRRRERWHAEAQAAAERGMTWSLPGDRD